MADACMPEELFEEVITHLPVEQGIGPQGGRPPRSHHTVVKVLWFVLTTGCRWEDVPLDMGCSGRTAHRRLQEWQELGIWGQVHAHVLKHLNKMGELDLAVAVIWRKLSFGTQSAHGSRFTERMLTAIETCRQQSRDVFAFLSATIEAHFHDQPAPSLLSRP